MCVLFATEELLAKTEARVLQLAAPSRGPGFVSLVPSTGLLLLQPPSPFMRRVPHVQITPDSV